MAESPKRPADVSRAEASSVDKPASPAALTGATARAADSVPLSAGPFPLLPMKFGRYRIEKMLGKGAMGAVYLAHDLQLERLVALKVARVSTAESAKLIQRMETEAKAAAKIDHPLICKVYEFSEIDGIRFIALQYIEGEDFKSYLKRVGRQREPAEALRWILQIAGALASAHEKGVIHRDLKPENIMLNLNGEPVIMDFGLARRTTGATNAGLTQGMIVGTAAYMSPEQAIGKAEGIDHRSDLYALGVMLFEMLTGEWPFRGTAIEVMGRKCVQEPPSPLSINPNLPPQLAEVCQKMIAQKKEDRFGTCAELITALDAIDLNAPVVYAMEVDEPAENAPFVVQEGPSFEFLNSPPTDAPVATSRTVTQKSKPQKNSSSSVMSTFTKWWADQPTAMRWTLIGCASTSLVLFAAVLFFRNGDALVKVEVHADDVEVTFQQETLTLADGAHHFQVKPGEKTLHIKSGNVEFDTDKFTLKRGDNPAVTVELAKSEIVAKLGDQEVGRRSLTVSSTDQANADSKIEMKVDPKIVKTDVNPSLADENRPIADWSKSIGWHGWPADAPPPAIAPFDADQAKKHQQAWADYLKLPVEYTNSIGMRFVLIPPGEFLMGSNRTEFEESLLLAKDDSSWQELIQSEAPQHKVILTQPFYVGACEVTQRQYVSVMGANPSWFSRTGGGKNAVTNLDTQNHPVETISWDEAGVFCAVLSKRESLAPVDMNAGTDAPPITGIGYRLPTEAEWEYACRAGTTTKYWIGDKSEGLVDVAWFLPESRAQTHAAGELKVNPFGMFDVHGNVAEWVIDEWSPTYYGQFSTSPAIDPCRITADSTRVFRGGDWRNGASYCRASFRRHSIKTSDNIQVGLRAVLPVEAVKAEIAERGNPTSLIVAPMVSIANETKHGEEPQPNIPSESKPKTFSPLPQSPADLVAPFTPSQAKDSQQMWAKYLKQDLVETNSIGSKLVLIPPGSFDMGSHHTKAELVSKFANWNTKEETFDNDRPTHRVSISRPFYLGRNEVTVGEFRRFVVKSGYKTDAETDGQGGKGWDQLKSRIVQDPKYNWRNPGFIQSDDHPVTNVTWSDAKKFCEWLASSEGHTYRLPTEAEWEYACKAGSMTIWSNGDDPEGVASVGNILDRTSKTVFARLTSIDARDGYVFTAPVGRFKSNSFGVHDMHGNVLEWCEDIYDANLYSRRIGTTVDPLYSGGGDSRVIRGGSWFVTPCSTRSAFRSGTAPNTRFIGIGFRVTRTADNKSQTSDEAQIDKPATMVVPEVTEAVIGEIRLMIPVTWKREPPANKLRLAQFSLPSVGGKKPPTELIISSFPGSGGDADANLKRWVGQFSVIGRKVKITTGKCAQGTYHFCDVAGTYEVLSSGLADGGKMEPKRNYRSLGVILAAKNGGNYFLRLIGPGKSVIAALESFRASFGAIASQENEYVLP
ncbi:MAG: SUMF1/EgtB/PvdO family nonheme iron enzyme [Planctomycetes bacterium]|nr:SUMF1/EgtB/PvdO family nonheme iron enzyme [Planctomycetota bacterium]